MGLIYSAATKRYVEVIDLSTAIIIYTGICGTSKIANEKQMKPTEDVIMVQINDLNLAFVS